MKIYKITEASSYLGISINSLKTLANNKNINLTSEDINFLRRGTSGYKSAKKVEVCDG